MMIKQRYGHIISISLTSGTQGQALDAAYCASKFGVIGLSEAIAEEFRQYGVKVNVVIPDAIDTPLCNQNGPDPRPANALPAPRVADLIIYLLTMPEGAILLNPIIVPLRTQRRTKNKPTVIRDDFCGARKAQRGRSDFTGTTEGYEQCVSLQNR
jgi:short-subunit dehydrogenase